MIASLWARLRHGMRRVRCRSDWESFVGADWAARIMEVPVTDRFHAKQGRSTGRWILQAGGRRLGVYLKRHYRLPWWHGWLALLLPGRSWSPAFQEWDHLHWAAREGLPVPEAVAASETVGPSGSLQSMLAVEELAGMVPVNEAIPVAEASLDADTFRRWKATLAVEMARISRQLHDRRRFHKDHYLCHFYILQTDIASVPKWRGKVHLIDLHRLGHHPWTWPLWQTKDLGQLLYSSQIAGVTARDRLRFWRAYRGERSLSWLRRAVLLKAGRYRSHNDKRRASATPLVRDPRAA
ncbi:MAG: hypothetical protein K2R98_03050 [Gemmataceae bacterium]|nr:hypothetical protein [Gemmataceae bacterium]